MEMRVERIISHMVVFSILMAGIHMFALQGKFQVDLTNKKNVFAIPNRGYYNQTQFKVKLECEPGTSVKIGWLLRLSECIDEFYLDSERFPDTIFQTIYQKPNIVLQNYSYVQYLKPKLKTYKCDPNLDIIDLFTNEQLHVITEKTNTKRQRRSASDLLNKLDKKLSNVTSHKKGTLNTIISKKKIKHIHEDNECIAKTWSEGPYLFIFYTEPVNKKPYNLKITLSMVHGNTYLAANDWPLLPFYGIMCGVYSIFALFWFVCSCLYWRDLLRLQLWIGGVILLGLMEKAAYLAEYESINKSGETVKIAILIAEIISCFKRSLARMLVIIVSLGFGIVKPRLGPTMQKVIGIGSLYFGLAVVDAFFRVFSRKEDTDSKSVLAGVPLVVIDVGVCYWILCNLQQTMRTLKVRRNIPKLSLYRHFTNTLIFSVLASVVFMAWSLKRHRFVKCLTDWQELWLDEGFWHMLFSFILLVIIILWRPSKNSQRFAFTPLLDNEEDADEEDDLEMQQETEIFDSIKMRQKANKKDKQTEEKQNSIEDDLKWVEDNVPATLIETAIPQMIDSEEELMATKFEASKMD